LAFKTKKIMQFTDTIETQVTETIMRAFSQFSKEPIMILETRDYNRVYSHIYKCLNELGLSERFRKDYIAVEEYKKGMRKRYQHKVESLREHFPNGCFTKDKHGELVGIDVMLAKMVKELSEIEREANER
jgi:hypothetical protein